MGKRTKLWQRWLSLVLAIYMCLSNVPLGALAQESEKEPETLAGKTISILGDSISTFSGVSNDSSVNATLSGSAVYYSGSNLGISQADTWWQQAIDALGMELLVNNSWSGSCILHTRSGTVGAYVDRCVNLHNDITGEEPDIIAVFLGTNDFSYYQSALGTGEIDYDTLITENADGTYTYATPTTSCEAYAIMLHKMTERYPEAEVYCMVLMPRRNPVYSGSDVGQPTAFNGALAQIADRFGCTVVDLENCGITSDPANFDLYMGDKRVHPNAAGMDKMTEALIQSLTGEKVTLYSLTTEMENARFTEESSRILFGGRNYSAVVAPQFGYEGLDVTVTMGGKDITVSAYADGKIAIANVTGDVVITAKAKNRVPGNYSWKFDGTDLVSTGESENALTKLAGTTTDGVFSDTRYQLEGTVTLQHDLPWVVEWQGKGSGGFMLAESTSASDAPFFFRRAGNYLNAFGDHDGSQFNNYGITYADGAAEHNYRLENRIADDDSNMVYLYVDDEEIGPLNNYYVGGTSKGTTGDWLSGKDFCINYIGTTSHPLTNYAMESLSVWEGGKKEEDTSFAFTVTPEDYMTVSRDETEKLACAPGLVTYGDGKFAVSYLADETNTVETESSTTIVCRLGLFDLDDPENGTFFDIATAGQTIGGVTIGSKAPYEPNLLKLSDRELLVLFNIRDTAGNYVYYSARFDTVSNTVTAYQPLTLDGKSWTPANIAASYNVLAETDISTSGPTGSMVFTSQIIQHEGYYYGYCGGICSGFSGILVRSTDGIHWTSVMVPEAASDMAGVIECGFQFLGDNVYFCMRDISSGVYHCSYDFTTGEQLVKTGKIPGVTTSKPTAFVQDGQLYVIVNKATGDDNTVGRRNTALFYQVNPETCRLSLARQVFCADGIAYHSVVNFNSTNYWCFHTDARRINPYTQGRSNLAFRKIPALYAAESGSNDGILDLNDYNHMYASGCITAATNTWQSGVVNMHYQIPLGDFADFDTVTITANSEQKAYIAFFADWMTRAGAIAYADGWTEQLILEPGTSRTLSIPEDAQYLYILNNNAAGANLLPESVVFSKAGEALSLRYDDHYDITGKTVEILDAGKPTSYQVGYGVEENAVLDTAVVTIEGDYLVATGIGTATVRMDGQLHEITVTAAPISLLLLAGQSNMEGMVGKDAQSIACENGQVYATYGKANGLTGDAGLTVDNAANHVASALSGAYSNVNVNGTDTKLSDFPINALTASGNGKYGMDSGIAYEWIRQTGEKVWIVNAAHGASSIRSWQKGESNYEEALALFTACQQVLEKEIAAGHYSLSHMGYYWCQGCADETQTAEWYAEQYMAMHESMKAEFGFDHDRNEATPERTLEFGNIVLVMAGHENALGYRKGAYADETNGFFATFKELEMRGPRVAQIWLANNPELDDIHIVSTIAQDWVTMPDGTDGVAEYFADRYPNGIVDYPTQVQQAASWYAPTTPGAVKNSIHYYQIGYNEVGREAARNTLYLLGEMEKPEVETTVSFVNWTGYETVENLKGIASASSQSLVVPMVYPCYESKTVTYSVSEGLEYAYYDLLDTGIDGGTLTASTGDKVTVTGRTYGAYHFEMVDGEPVSANDETFRENVPVANGTANTYTLTEPIVLKHNKEWIVEFNSVEGSRFMALASAKNPVDGMWYIFKSQSGSGVLAMGEYKDGLYQNYGLLQTEIAVDWTQPHVYRFRNVINADGSNTIHMDIDGKNVGTATNQIINSVVQNRENTYLSGKDFVFSNIGCSGFALGSGQMTYLTVWEEGEQEPAESLALRYDDHYDISGKTVEILDAGKPTSYQVGYGVEENKVPDTAVVTIEGNYLVATGIGTAMVRIDGQLHEVTVTAAPISLLLLAGQSNMQGIDGDPKQSVVCPEGMVYATYADRYQKTVADVTKFAPSALSGEHSNINVTGDAACLENYPVYMLTAPGNGREGMDSGLAYEWVRRTGEKVWVVNLGYGGSSIKGWLEGGEHYNATLALLSACQETLRKEIAAGHFTLSHMGYFWCQGCADETQTAQWYAEKYQTMHGLFKSSLTFDHDSNAATPEKTMEFGGIIPIRSGHAGYGSYRAGVYNVTTNASYYQSFKDLRFNGPRVAQYWMGNNPALTDIWNVCTIQEDWATMPDGTDGVADYFRSAYENGRVDYPVQVAQSDAWYTPTTPAAVHDNIHYNQIGYNEIGRESARNALILLGETEAPEAEATVEFISWDGFTPVAEMTASITGNADTLVVPMVSPVWKSKEVTYDLSDGLTYSYYDLLTRDQKTKGVLTAIGAEGSVAVTGMRELTAYNWTFDGSALVSSPGENFTDDPLSLLGGKVENGIFNNVRYGLKKSIRLFHDQEWGLEIRLSNWTAAEGSMILATGPDAAVGQPYLYFRPADYFVGFGCYDGSSYHNYGISLKNQDVACNEGSHTYRFVNRVLEDGTNQIWLFVDDREIGPLTEHYTNSALSDTGNNWLSGKDFDLSNIGTGGWPIRGCTLNGIRVFETNYDPDIHFHQWSAWQQITAPGPEGPGLEQRSCACGETESREVEGVWQTHELSKYLVALPEAYCGGTNLWTVLPHTQTYYYGGTHWAPNTGADVWAVTIPVEPGDKIFATAFGKAGDNGYTSNGIRCTFFDAEGVCKTTGPAETYAEFSANGGYLIAPEGAVAVNIPMYGDKDTYELYILNAEHRYENGSCTLCGAEHPNLEKYRGKVISILGDSISTFAGYIPVADGFNLEHYARYPQDNLLTDVNETWWMQVIDQLDAKLGINDSWRSTEVYNYIDAEVNDTYDGTKACMASTIRIQNLGSNGTPDVILFFGGTNDITQSRPLGTFDPALAPTEVDLISVKWETVADAYVDAIMRMQYYYPDAQIIAMLPFDRNSQGTAKVNKYNSLFISICEHYGVPYTDLRECGITNADLPDGTHPDAKGMDDITEAVLDALLVDCDVTAGEHIVHSVTHNLTDAKSSLSYYKGVSHGKPFKTTVTGENLKVTVTMGGADITANCYANGVISIGNVTGDLVITATGTPKTVYADYLQELPEEICSGTNLWTALKPINLYYTGSGWGNTGSGSVYSVTIPISAGDQIWATSFQKSGTNGGSRNGIRLTWFDENGVLESIAPDDVYAEFSANAFVTAPEGTAAVNVVMWNGNESNEVYLLNRDHTYENGSCTLCGEKAPWAAVSSVDLFVFAGQSNMMGAAVLEPEVNTFTDNAWEYKYMPKLRGQETGSFVPAQNSAGEWHYRDLDTAYGENRNDLTYQSTLSNYSANTYFCPAMSNGTKGFSAQSEADMYPSASLPPYFAAEYASYGHSSIYAHMAKGAVKITHYFTEEMINAYNALISEYNAENGTSYASLSTANLSGAGNAFDAKYTAMVEDYVTATSDGSIANKCFVWLQGESEGGSCIEYKLKMQVLWEHLQELGFTHFFVLRVGFWGSTSVRNVIKAQEEFCAENENCYIVTRAPSLIPHPDATTDNWWISEPSGEYADCRDSYVVEGSGNHHFNEKAMQLFAERSAENIHRILYQGLEPILEEENIQGMPTEDDGNQPEEDGTPYTSYIGTQDFCNQIAVSKPQGEWVQISSASARSTDLIPVKSTDSVWLQYVFIKSEAHAVGGFYDADGNLVAPLYYQQFGFSLDGNTGGVTAFRTPESTNRISIAEIEAATGKKIAFVRFTAWQASEGGHANTEARVYHGAESKNLEGKVISILGDSISTFAGYIPVADGFNLEHLPRYPQDNLLTDVKETWWMQVVNELDAKLGINDSWRGATVSGAHAVTTGSTGENASMANLTRQQNLGSNGTPDVILFYGGTNDLAHVSKVGTFDPATAPTTVDLTTKKWDNLADGYVHTLLRLRYYYPDALVLAMLPTVTTSYYSNAKLDQANEVLADICDHYGVPYVDLRDCGLTTADLPDGIHPNAKGMDFITEAVLEALLDADMEAGENVVYTVKHDLTEVTASLGHYKGISAGKSFEETITGDGLTVTVTMGGADITASAYADGNISIPAVTGDLVITARGEFTANGHLQQLPEAICAGTNLWTALTHDEQYYTASGWGVHGSGKVYSVTFPVSGGDEIYATSFGKAGENGSSTNGIRVTWFLENGKVSSLGADAVYTEFAAKGFLTAPEGAIAVCVPMWTKDAGNELYILNAAHDFAGITCTLCGACTDLTHIVAYGQSFSVGGDAPIYADPAVDGVYVLGSITNSSGDALTAIPATGTQHPIISAVNALSKLLSGEHIDTDIIVGSYGAGAKTIAQLMSQERQAQIKTEEGYSYDILSSGRYGVFQNSVAAVADYARENDKTVSCPAIVYLQGETDQNTDAQLGYPDNPQWAAYAAGGDKEKYKEYMSRLKEDMQREVMEAYGQTEKPLFLIYQVSGTYVRTNDSAINMAQLEFAQENEDVILIQTPYFTPHYTNSHHLTVNGYRWLGEYIGQTLHTALTKQTKTWPMLPQKFVWEDTKTLRITVSGAVNGLTIDTWTVEDATNSGNKYGFYLVSNGKTVVPKTVSVEGNDIVLTFLDGAITLEEEGTISVYYGGRGAKGTGNIRDNATKTGFYCYLDDSADTGTGNNQGVSHSALDENGNSIIGQPYPLYNWLASFCQEIEAPVAEKKAPASYYWEMQESGLVSVTEGQAEENELTLLQGSVENGIIKNAQYSMEKTIVLYHDRPWVIEWKAAGNGSSYGGGKIFSASQSSGSSVRYLYLPADSRGFLAWGVASEGRNYGIKLGQLGIDTRQEHVYRIENRIAEDGTNTVYLIVDGVEIGDMNTPYSTKDGSLIDDAKNWANGTDIYLDLIGEPANFLVNNMKLFYLKVSEDSRSHSYHYAVGKEPTLTETGALKGICEICNEKTVVELPKLDEAAYDYAVTTEPTYTESGLATYTWKETAYGTHTFEVVLETLPILYGDVNGDGTVNNKDRLVLTRYLAKWTDYPEEIINMAAADVNGDGKVNNLDRLILTRHLAKWTGYEELPYKQ